MHCVASTSLLIFHYIILQHSSIYYTNLHFRFYNPLFRLSVVNIKKYSMLDKLILKYLADTFERVQHSNNIVFLSEAAYIGVFSIAGFFIKVLESEES